MKDDEQKQNQAIDTEENVRNDTGDNLKNGVNDGVDLAKNIASHNYFGAVMDGFKLLKNKTVLIVLIILLLLPIIFAGLILGIFVGVSDTLEGSTNRRVSDSDSSEELEQVYNVNYDEYGIITISDEKIDEIISKMQQLGISIEDLYLSGDIEEINNNDNIEDKNKEVLRYYVRKFYEAQAVTQVLYLNPPPDKKIEGATYGNIYVQRMENGQVSPLSYISYAEIEQMAKNKDLNIKNYFSVDENNRMVIAKYIKTTVEENGTNTKDEFFIDLMHINYEPAVSQYTTSMNFFFYLTMITKNPEFVSKVADLVKNSNIKITLMDKIDTSITAKEQEYTLNTKTVERVESEAYDAWDTQHQYPHTSYSYEASYEKEEKKDTTNTTIVTTTPQPAVTYAKTWFSEQTIEYIKNDTVKEENSYTETKNEEEPENDGAGTYTWITDSTSNSTISGSQSIYEETNRGDVIDKTGKKGDGESSFIGLMDVEFKLPNQNKKVKASESLLNRSESEMLFYLLQKSESCQNLENVMRYILYKYTEDRTYGVTSLDKDVYNITSFTSVADSNLSAFGTTLTKEQFISIAKSYNGGQSYETKMIPLLEDFYNICTSVEYNVNPALAFAHACLETGYGENTPYNNYFGMNIGNGQESGTIYNTPQESIEDYCKWVVSCATPGTGEYNENVERSQRYSIGNSNLDGTPDNNIYALYSGYAYLGNTHICDEPNFASPAGKSYYEANGSNWGSGGRIYIYDMYEKGGLYTGEYAIRCGHPNGSDLTTITERADYSVYTTNKRIKIARNIFGDNVI